MAEPRPYAGKCCKTVNTGQGVITLEIILIMVQLQARQNIKQFMVMLSGRAHHQEVSHGKWKMVVFSLSFQFERRVRESAQLACRDWSFPGWYEKVLSIKEWQIQTFYLRITIQLHYMNGFLLLAKLENVTNIVFLIRRHFFNSSFEVQKMQKWWNDKINDLNMMSQDIGEFIYLEKMLGSPKMITLARM